MYSFEFGQLGIPISKSGPEPAADRSTIGVIGRTLNRWWLAGHPNRECTSVSFLLDRNGVTRRVHLGGLIDVKSEEFRAIEADVERLLAER